MYKIMMTMEHGNVDMPKDKGLEFLDACNRAVLYKKRNNARGFLVVNEDNGDVDYQA